MKIALIQMEVLAKQRAQNIKHGLELLEKVQVTADVAILPEVWTTGYSLGKLSEQAETMEGEVVKQLSKIARTKKIYIVAGSMAMNFEGKYYNTSLVFDKTGEILAKYSKIHLFSLFAEEQIFTAGSARKVMDIAGITSGVAICYDIRFPELIRAMAVDGAKVIYLPAEWPAVRGDAWELMVRANAAINQVYICAVNCVGEFKGEKFYGNSMIVSPLGEILQRGTAQEEIIYGELDITQVDKVRAGMSVLKDLRTDLYG